MDITPNEIDGVRALIKAQPSVTAPPEMLPVVSSRIVEIDGVPASQAKLKNFPKRMLQSISLTWATATPPGTSAVAGKWWQADEKSAGGGGQPARRGTAGGEGRIAYYLCCAGFAVYGNGGCADEGGWATCLLACCVYSAAGCAGWTAGGLVWRRSCRSGAGGELQRALYHAYPTVTVINVAQALETVRSVVIQITYVIQFLAAFSIFAGIIILASSIAGTRIAGSRRWSC